MDGAAIKMKQNEFELLCALERKKQEGLFLQSAATEAKLLTEEAVKVIQELQQNKLVECRERKLYITEEGLEQLEPYRVKRAVIIAAGFGSRMVPITWNTPKPLVRVHGKKIVETLLDAIQAAEIPEVILVRGYLWEQFDQLLYQYPNIKFIQNDDYENANNVSSVYLARHLLENAYVCEADLYINNPAVVRKYEYASNYLGVPRTFTDDWCFQTKNGYIKKLLIGGENVHHMYGISYWTTEDGQKLVSCLEDAYLKYPGGSQLYWDEVPLKLYIDQFHVQVRSCKMEDIIEIDTFEELQKVDPMYKETGV